MANNKKRKKPSGAGTKNKTSYNNRQAGAARGGSVTVKERKRQLIRERIHTDDKLYSGMRIINNIGLTVILLRLALLAYEISYYLACGVKVSIVSNLLIIPVVIIIFMARDGNRGLMAILSVSAVVRALYLFLSMLPELEGHTGVGVFVGVYTAVMAAQFVLSVTVLSMPKVDLYCKEIQKINNELRSNIINSGK